MTNATVNTTATTEEEIIESLFNRVIEEQELTEKQIKKINNKVDDKFFKITCLDLDEEAVAIEVAKLEKEGKIHLFTEKEIYYGDSKGFEGYIFVHPSNCFHFKDGSPHIDVTYNFYDAIGLTACVRSWKDYINCAKYFAYLFNLKLCIY